MEQDNQNSISTNGSVNENEKVNIAKEDVANGNNECDMGDCEGNGDDQFEELDKSYESAADTPIISIIPEIVIEEVKESKTKRDEMTDQIINEPDIDKSEMVCNESVIENGAANIEENTDELLNASLNNENYEGESGETSTYTESLETVTRNVMIKARPPLRSKFNSSFSVRSEPSSPSGLAFNSLHKVEAQQSLNESLSRKRPRTNTPASETSNASKRVCRQPWFSWWGDDSDASDPGAGGPARSCSIM